LVTPIICPSSESGTDGRIGARLLKDAFTQGLHVQRRADDDEHRVTPILDLKDSPLSVFNVLGDGELLGGFDDVYQVMRDQATDFLRGFGGADVHPPVDFHGVDADDLTAGAAGKRAAKPALPGPGTADDESKDPLYRHRV